MGTILKVFWEGSREASGDDLFKSDKLWQNFSVNNLRELRRAYIQKISFSYEENEGIV